MDLGGKVESLATEKDGLAKVVVDLEARLKESETRLEESKLWAAKERKVSRELEEELILYKKEVVEQYEKQFQKAIRHVDFFAKDVKEGVLLDEEEINVVKSQGSKQKVELKVNKIVLVSSPSFLTVF